MQNNNHCKKIKLMKKVLLSYLTMMLFTGIFAQVDPPIDRDKMMKRSDSIRDEIINKSEYVFEGNIIKNDIYFRNNSVTSSEIVKISKVFRGNIVPGTIEIVSYSSLNMDGDLRVTGHINSDDKFGIFFCRFAKEFPNDPKYNIDKVDNKVILAYKGIIKYSSPYGYTELGVLKRGKINTKAEIYKILKRYPNLNIPETAEKEPWDNDNSLLGLYPRIGTFKSSAAEDVYIDSVNRSRGFTKPKQTIQKKDSIKNVTRP